MERRDHCFYCGEDLGPHEPGVRELQSCGQVECDRELRHAEEAQEAEAREAAEQDGFSRYGGPGGL